MDSEKRRGGLGDRPSAFANSDDFGPGADEESKDPNYAIDYLDFCVHRLPRANQKAAIHNFLLWLYVEEDSSGEAVLRFVNERASPYFDLDYALRVCMKAGQKRACVQIYTMMDMFDEAVTLALQIDEVELAKEYAAQADTDEMRKKLWLKIARKVIEQVTHGYHNGDIKQAIKILSDSDDLLKIEDILPLFPDFTTIDDFKTEICEALEDYNSRIDALKEEMHDYVESAREIRRDIKKLRTRHVTISSTKTCEICGRGVAGTNFYVFPDQRVYRVDCLADWVIPHLPPEQAQEVRTLRQQIQAESRNVDGTDPDAEKKLEQLQIKFDDIVASGWLIDKIMIDNIDKPFAPEVAVTDEDVREARLWAL